MILKEYPSYQANTLQEVIEHLRQINNIRKDDILQAKNLNNTYILGRKVGKIPTGSADVTAGDKIGDFNAAHDGFQAYAYFLIDNGSGTAQWHRTHLTTW